MFAGIYYGGMYGGSTTSILLNTPGEAASIVTALEGNKMAKAGRGAAALATAAIGSFVAGTIATGLLSLVAPQVVRLAVKLGPADYVALMALAFVMVSAVLGSSLVRGLASLGSRFDDRTHRHRCADRPGTVHPGRPAAAGRRRRSRRRGRTVRGRRGAVGGLAPSPHPGRTDSHQGQVDDQVRLGDGPGSPGCGAPRWASPSAPCPQAARRCRPSSAYALEKRLSKHKDEFGKGAIEGVAGPEAANNAAAAGVLVPLLSLGLPTSATAAILLAAFQQYGLQPGPQLFTNNSGLVWALIASLYIGNLMLLVLNLPLAGIWVKLLRIPRPYLYAGILMFAALGSYTVNLSPIDLALLLVLGALGLLLPSLRLAGRSAIVGLILGPLAEQQLRRALAISQGDVSILFSSAFSIVLYAATAARLGRPRGSTAETWPSRRMERQGSTPAPETRRLHRTTTTAASHDAGAPLQTTSTPPVNRAAVPAPTDQKDSR